MRSILCFSVVLLALSADICRAQDVRQWARNLQGRFETVTGPIDEGSHDYRNDLGTGSVKSWLTRPGAVTVSEPANSGGTIRFNFTGREKDQDYLGGVHRGTHYNNRSGYVSARYDFAFSGKVYITSVEKHGTSDRVGNGIVAAINAQNGRIIDSAAFVKDFEADRDKKGIKVTGDLEPLTVGAEASKTEETAAE